MPLNKGPIRDAMAAEDYTDNILPAIGGRTNYTSSGGPIFSPTLLCVFNIGYFTIALGEWVRRL